MEGLTAVTFGTPAFWLVLGILLAVTFPAVSAGVSLPGDWGFCWPRSDVRQAVPHRIPLLPLQGPLEIGPGCLLTGLTVDSSPALQGCPLRDVVLQGHHVRLRDLPCRVFTLTGRLDDWQVRGQRGATGLSKAGV